MSNPTIETATNEAQLAVDVGDTVPAPPEARADGKAYIDEVPCAEEEETQYREELDEDEEDDGSSIFESDDEGLGNPDGGWPREREEGEGPEMDDEEMLDWGVEDEDWELADGDFTKQYNRVRQSYAAVDLGTGAKLSTAPASGSLTPASARPLPARNANAAARRARAPIQSGTTGKTLVNPGILGGVSANPKSAAERANQKDKADRATHEQVLDARTRLVLSALVNRGFFGVIDGVVSTGKEANVYLAFPGANTPPTPSPYPAAVAVKIYRTSILNFRARQNYIVGEQRFKGGYSSAKNPRKMVRLWAEKELRNLRRLLQGGVRAPIVIEQRENVLVMEFLGKDGIASPRLKDADISMSKLPRLYGELLVSMRRMYHVCRLVHADLSEYNILYHASHLYIIDVSQSVEQDHPSAFDFLRSDIRNVEDFFHKRSNGEVRTLGIRRAWSFIVDESVGLSREDEAGDEGEQRLLDILREWLDKEPLPEPEADKGEGTSASTNTAAQVKNQAAVDDAVFFSSYIPRSLGEVYDPERDVDLLRSGQGDKLIYASLTGLDINEGKEPAAGTSSSAAQAEEAKGAAVGAETASNSDLPTAETAPAAEALEPTFSAAPEPASPAKPKKGVRWEDEVTPPPSDEEEEPESFEKKSRGFRNENKEANKERKKALKEENREKRKNKMPKSEKARLIKKSGGK